MSLNAVRQLSAEIPTDDFNALEEKVYRAIELYKAARDAKTVAERSAERLREQLEQREETLEDLRRETVALKREREDVRGRVENMLRQIETMTEEVAGG
jgi:chromosome segregation ATPase